MNKKKLIIIIVLVVGVVGYVAKGFLMPPAVAKEKINGTIYILPKQFTLNLSDNHYATLTVALVLAPGQSTGASAEAAPTTDGFGTLPEEAAVRDIITSIVTNQNSAALISTTGRERIKQLVLSEIVQKTDVKIKQVLFTDVAVQ